MSTYSALFKMSEERKKRPPKAPKRKKSSNASSPKSSSSRSSSPVRKKKKAAVAAVPVPKKEVAAIQVIRHACARHGKAIKYYDERRDELLCEDCGQGTPAEESFRRRSAYFYNYLNSDLVVKRQQLDSQLQRVRRAGEELQHVKLNIERDMKGEFSAIQERLNSVFGAREAVLSHDSSELRADIQRIQEVASLVDRYGSDTLEFLKRSGEIKDTLEFSLAKPFKTEVEVDAWDLPQELAEVRDKVASAPALLALNSFKAELFSRLKKPDAPSTIHDEEIKSWASLVENYSRQLSRLRLNCSECGVTMSPETVNGMCGESRHFFK
jgi:palmitoyltransferase